MPRKLFPYSLGIYSCSQSLLAAVGPPLHHYQLGVLKQSENEKGASI